jgi:hypothetical protein
MKAIKKLIPLAVLVMFLVVPSLLIAQPPPDPCPDPQLPDCPIDSGLVLLIAAAVLIALKKAFDYKKKVYIQIPS